MDLEKKEINNLNFKEKIKFENHGLNILNDKKKRKNFQFNVVQLSTNKKLVL